MTAQVNGNKLFECSAGVRGATALDGRGLQLVGINTTPQSATLKIGGQKYELSVPPNQVQALR